MGGHVNVDFQLVDVTVPLTVLELQTLYESLADKPTNEIMFNTSNYVITGTSAATDVATTTTSSPTPTSTASITDTTPTTSPAVETTSSQSQTGSSVDSQTSSIVPTPATSSSIMTSSYVTPGPTNEVTLQGSIKITSWTWDDELYDFSSDLYYKTNSRISGIVSLFYKTFPEIVGYIDMYVCFLMYVSVVYHNSFTTKIIMLGLHLHTLIIVLL